MKKNRIRFFKFSDGKQNLQFHWPNLYRVSFWFFSTVALLENSDEFFSVKFIMKSLKTFQFLYWAIRWNPKFALLYFLCWFSRDYLTSVESFQRNARLAMSTFVTVSVKEKSNAFTWVDACKIDLSLSNNIVSILVLPRIDYRFRHSPLGRLYKCKATYNCGKHAFHIVWLWPVCNVIFCYLIIVDGICRWKFRVEFFIHLFNRPKNEWNASVRSSCAVTSQDYSGIHVRAHWQANNSRLKFNPWLALIGL
jgi:hypothetical protein